MHIVNMDIAPNTICNSRQLPNVEVRTLGCACCRFNIRHKQVPEVHIDFSV